MINLIERNRAENTSNDDSGKHTSERVHRATERAFRGIRKILPGKKGPQSGVLHSDFEKKGAAHPGIHSHRPSPEPSGAISENIKGKKREEKKDRKMLEKGSVLRDNGRDDPDNGDIGRDLRDLIGAPLPKSKESRKGKSDDDRTDYG